MNASAEPGVSLQSAVDLFPFGVAYYRGGRYAWVNQALCAMTGHSAQTLLSVDPFSLLAPEDEQRVRERFRARQRGEAPTATYEIQVQRPDGSRTTLELEAHSVGPDAAVLLYRDLSPHRRAQKLLEGLAQLAARVQTARSPEAVRSAALEGLFALGFQATIAVIEPDGFACSWRVCPELDAVMQPALVKHLAFGRFPPLDTCVRTLEPVYIEDAIEAIRPNFANRGMPLEPDRVLRLRKLGLDKLALAPLSLQGKPFGVLAAGGDGMDRQTAAALALFAAQLASALDVASTIVELQRQNRRLAAINALANAGNEPDPAELRDRLLRIIMEATTSDAVSIFRAGKDGLLLDATINVPAWFAERYNTLPFASTVSGGTAATRKARALMVKDWPPEHHEHLRRAGGIASALLPLEVKGKLSGLIVLCRNREEPYRDEDMETAELLADQVAVQLERAQLVLALRQSYDELALTQKELVKRERLAALGELSAVIAHEVRNPLGALFNSLAALRHMIFSNDARELLAIVSEESERLDRLVSDLLDFARPHSPKLAPESPALLVMGAVESARRGTALQSVTVRVEVPPGLPLVQIDMQLCRQALLNLLLNAAQASDHGGEVVVRACLEPAARPPMVRLDVCDRGVGIAPEVAERIFQPFFTTRASGTGLGLALVKRIAESHRAEVGFESSRDKGTTFSLRLPVSAAAPPQT